MNDESINEKPLDQAIREGLLKLDDSGLELGDEKVAGAKKSAALGPVSRRMPVVVVVLDALAIIVFLTVSPVAGAVLFIVSSIVLSRRLSSLYRATTREGRRR